MESIALDIKSLLTIGGIIFGAGGVFAGVKIKQALSENQQDGLKKATEKNETARVEADKEILTKIETLSTSMTTQFHHQNTKQADVEKSMAGNLDNFKEVVVARLDDVGKGQAELDKRLTVAESEHRHIREKVEKHGKKITMMGQLRPPPRDSE